MPSVRLRRTGSTLADKDDRRLAAERQQRAGCPHRLHQGGCLARAQLRQGGSGHGGDLPGDGCRRGGFAGGRWAGLAVSLTTTSTATTASTAVTAPAAASSRRRASARFLAARSAAIRSRARCFAGVAFARTAGLPAVRRTWLSPTYPSFLTRTAPSGRCARIPAHYSLLLIRVVVSKCSVRRMPAGATCVTPPKGRRPISRRLLCRRAGHGPASSVSVPAMRSRGPRGLSPASPGAGSRCAQR